MIKEIAIKINSTLRELLMNSSFINFGNFYDINKYATEKYVSYWINNLLGFIVSKKILTDTALEKVVSEDNLVLRLKFLELYL
jgi:hypothetical protein